MHIDVRRRRRKHGAMILMKSRFEDAVIRVAVILEYAVVIGGSHAIGDHGGRERGHESIAVVRLGRGDAALAVSRWRGSGVSLKAIAALRRFSVSSSSSSVDRCGAAGLRYHDGEVAQVLYLHLKRETVFAEIGVILLHLRPVLREPVEFRLQSRVGLLQNCIVRSLGR